MMVCFGSIMKIKSLYKFIDTVNSVMPNAFIFLFNSLIVIL